MPTEIDLQSPDAIRHWLKEWMANELGLEAGGIDPDQPFLGYGMDSMSAMMLVGDLEGIVGRRLPPTLAWDHPTVGALAAHIAELAHAEAPTVSQPVEATVGSSPPDPRTILAQLDGMTEAEMDALLEHYAGRHG